ncbi:cobyrinic acid a,c-diamide synthase [compost metagenome]
MTDKDGRWTALWGLLPGKAQMQKRLAGLGMQQLATPWGLLRGHSFHYARLESSAPVQGRSSRPEALAAPDQGELLYRHGSLHASFFHAWFASLLGARENSENTEAE